ncbi:RpnC/YadD family protein [Pedobacter duraquae]|uniref:Uncharacterized protein n=1 Tax=Pedobacter duraquae TaxID=425511 RepID=A0A4V3C318_9SPHI|nr:hypothetical protein [Pedobacter duraquae]TDO20309.1 hypothetical protein CLV32_4069 [Pedobacter duraquae]
MQNQDQNNRQANQYDKIIKENLEVTLPVIIRDVLGLDILLSEELPDDVQHTKERKPDALKKVTDTSGKTYVLQVEFQVQDEQEMVYRMAEYNIMLMRKYRLPIKQYVIFLKDAKPLMDTVLDTEYLKFHFTLIMVSEASYKLFLRSNNASVKMLGILANFDKEDSFQVVKSIVDGIQSAGDDDFAKSRYFKQLRIMLQLRKNIEQQFEQAMQSVSTFFKEENDFLYRKGEIKGADKKSHAVVMNLIVKLGFTDDQIAELAEVELEYIKKIRAELAKK